MCLNAHQSLVITSEAVISSFTLPNRREKQVKTRSYIKGDKADTTNQRQTFKILSINSSMTTSFVVLGTLIDPHTNRGQFKWPKTRIHNESQNKCAFVHLIARTRCPWPPSVRRRRHCPRAAKRFHKMTSLPDAAAT